MKENQMTEQSESRYEEFSEQSETAPEEAQQAEPTTLERLEAQFGDAVLATSTRLGEPTAIVGGGSLVDIMTWLRDTASFVLLSDLTAHDCYGGSDEDGPRFWVIYQLTNLDLPERLRVKVGLPEKKPVVDSVVGIWPGANFYEREVYDLFGIEFTNHPDLRRIMMPDEWEGHPLRKDFPLIYEPVQFTHNQREIREGKPFAER
jgi:NADH-quinone oxidoreductase subunit C